MTASDTGSAGPNAGESLRLWLALHEQVTRSASLHDELETMRRSQSWRVTAPLRALRKWLGQRTESAVLRPRLRPAPTPPGNGGVRPGAATATAFIPVAARAMLNAAGASALYVDVTELDLEDLGAGVQRVTKRLLAELIIAPPPGYRVEPVRLAENGQYFLARPFLARMLGLASAALDDEAEVQPRVGDVFLGLDLVRDHAALAQTALDRLRERGAVVVVVAYDMLPAEHPEWFPPGIPAGFEAWLRMLSACADRVVCISEVTRGALKAMLARRGLQAPAGGVAVMPLGGDAFMHQSAPPPREDGVRRVLMVGTLEPRKGHAQALSAFERLWASRAPVELMIAGRPGWQSDALHHRLRTHSEFGRRLHWLEGPDDALVAALYSSSDLLLMASSGEGLGLPIVEAGHYGCELLLRDLPVFRETAGDSARYFMGDMPEALERALRAWLDETGSESNVTSTRRWPTWADSAAVLAAYCAEVGRSGRNVSPMKHPQAI